MLSPLSQVRVTTFLFHFESLKLLNRIKRLGWLDGVITVVFTSYDLVLYLWKLHVARVRNQVGEQASHLHVDVELSHVLGLRVQQAAVLWVTKGRSSPRHFVSKPLRGLARVLNVGCKVRGSRVVLGTGLSACIAVPCSAERGLLDSSRDGQLNHPVC
jgi:hypothetical protein